MITHDALAKRARFIWKAYPRLKAFVPYFREYGMTDKQIDQHLRMTILFVGKKSPFYSEKNFHVRYELCLNELGYESKEIDKDQLEEFIYHYFIWVNDRQFEAWYSKKVSFHEQNKFIRRGIDDDTDATKVNRVSTAIDELNEQIIKIENSLFPDEYTEKIISRKVAETQLTGFAEEFAIPRPFQN